MRILVVDDLAANRRLLSRILAHLGHDADVASNGEQALAELARIDYDVIFMDLQMPDMDGFETARRVRAGGHQRVRIIAVSGFADEQVARQSAEAGMDGYIGKPFAIATIGAALG